MTSPELKKNRPQKLSQETLSLAFCDQNGNKNQLINMLDKPILLTYWATWCHHCVAELPALAQLYTEVKNDIHLIIMVNEDINIVDNYLKKKGFNLPVYRQLTIAPANLNSKKIPASFLIDTNKNLL